MSDTQATQAAKDINAAISAGNLSIDKVTPPGAQAQVTRALLAAVNVAVEALIENQQSGGSGR
jgi:hypothetical protein